MGLDSLRKDLNSARFERSNLEHEAELQEIIASLRAQDKYEDYTDEELREIAQEMPSKRLKGYAESLKKQDKYKDFSDDELLKIAAAKIARINTSIIGDDIHYSVLDPEKPSDPIWSQYDYEQILNMASEGVNVPKEFLDWANAMADTNTTAYELETDPSGDFNTADNLAMGTDEDNQLSKQKKLLRYASKAEQQGAFLEQAGRTIQSDKADIDDNKAALESEQAQATAKIQKLTNEYNALNQKIANGENVSDSDMQRFKELGTILNVQQQELLTKSKNFETELKTLVSQMNSFNTVSATNDSINNELTSLSLLYSGEEGGKKHSYTQAMLNNVAVGDVAAYAYMAQSLNITPTATTIGNNLHVLTNNFNASLNNNLGVTGRTNANLKSNNKNNTVENNTETDNQPTLSAPTTDETSTDTIDNTSDTSGVDATNQTQNTEEAALQQYIEECSSKSLEMQSKTDGVTALKNQVQDLQKSRLTDTVRSTAEFNKSLKSLEKLIEKIRNANSVSEKDISEFQSLSSVLDSQNGSIATDMLAKIDTLDSFTSSIQTSLAFSTDTSEYANTVIEAGKTYAQEHIKYSTVMLRMASDKNEQYDILYGKSGESIARDVIDNGEALAKQATEAQIFLNSTAELQGFAGQYTSQLTEKLSANNAKVTPLANEFEQIIAEKSNNDNNADNTDKTNSNSAPKKEEATQDDINNVEDKGRKADKDAKDAKRDGDEALSDKEKCERDIKKNTMQMKQTQAQIKKLTKENISNNAQIVTLYNQAENEANIAAEESSSNDNSGLSSRNSNPTDSTAEEHIATINNLTAQSEKLGMIVTTNGNTIKVLEDKSVKTHKSIVKSSNAKYKAELQEQKQKEEDAQKTQKTINTVTDIGKAFTATKLTGMALMLMPWSAAAGTIMYNIGKYGEITSYATNASLNVAQGNLLGAGINLGAAALSFASAAPTSSAATEGVKESAKEGLKEAGKEAGKEVATETGKEVAKETAKEAAKEAAKETSKEAVKEGTKEVAKEAATETAKEATKEIVKDTTSTSLQASVETIAPDGLGVFNSTVSTAGVGEAMKEVSEKVSQQIAAEAAKSAAKEQLKNSVKNTIVSTAQQSLLNYGEKLQQKDTKQDKKKKILTEFERKRRNEIRKGIEKIKKSMNAK